jgi:hypothetical protein
MVPKARAALQTFHTIQASDLAAAFNDALKRVRIGPGEYSAELTAPEGPSTAGGVQAMQHLRLVPRQPGLPTLVVGHANHAEEKAELRTYEHLDAVHRQRFRRPLAIDRGQYEDFLRLTKQLLDVLHLKTSIVGPPLDLEDDGPRSGTSRRSRTPGLFPALTVALLAGAAFALYRSGLLTGLIRALATLGKS